LIPVKWYSDLANLRHKVGDRPVLLVCDNALSQDYVFDQEWAVFFLKHVNLEVPKFFGYLGAKFYEPLMQRAKSIRGPADFVLVNQRIEGALWQNRHFSLLELGNQPILIGVQAPNGLKHVNGKPFIWLGKQRNPLPNRFENCAAGDFFGWGICNWSESPGGQGSTDSRFNRR